HQYRIVYEPPCAVHDERCRVTLRGAESAGLRNGPDRTVRGLPELADQLVDLGPRDLRPGRRQPPSRHRREVPVDVVGAVALAGWGVVCPRCGDVAMIAQLIVRHTPNLTVMTDRDGSARGVRSPVGGREGGVYADRLRPSPTRRGGRHG